MILLNRLFMLNEALQRAFGPPFLCCFLMVHSAHSFWLNVWILSSQQPELNSPPTLWNAGELSCWLWKPRAKAQARRKGRTWGNNNPQLEAPREGSASCLVPFPPGQLKVWNWHSYWELYLTNLNLMFSFLPWDQKVENWLLFFRYVWN